MNAPETCAPEPIVASGRLPLKENGRTIFVPLTEVEYLEASGNYVRVYAGAEQYLVREKLAAFAARLPGQFFVRIHRSVIVNRRLIHELRRSFSGKYLVTLVSGKQVTLSRSHRQSLAVLREPEKLPFLLGFLYIRLLCEGAVSKSPTYASLKNLEPGGAAILSLGRRRSGPRAYFVDVLL